MSAADVTLMTSDWEGSPVTVKESLACGTPVISVPVGDVAELVNGLPGCEIVPRDSRALAAAIHRALAIQRPLPLRERALEYARRPTAQRVVAVYRSILDARAVA